jgi:hypothetical protein
MRFFANLFLLLFLADGSLSLLDELASLFFPLVPISGLRGLLANAVILAAIPLYLSLGIDRRLPKRLFLPLILFAFWCPISVWIFPVLGTFKLYGLFMAALQVALGTFLVSRFNENPAAPLTLPPTLFEGPYFDLRNTLAFAGINILVLPAALLTAALFLANSYAVDATGGFLNITPRGLYMAERTYRRGDRTVKLAGMIHIGEKEYYDEVAQLVPPGNTVVLAEGVTDEKGKLKNKFDYRKVADLLGLASQEKLLFKGRLIEPKDLETGGKGGGKEPAAPDILRADVDVGVFRPETMMLLDAMGRELRGNPSTVDGLLKLNRWAEQNVTPAMYAVIMDDILQRRNQVVVGYLDRALKSYRTVVIPWGALHMKGIEAEVLKRGFVLQEEKKRLSVDFGRMLLATPDPKGHPGSSSGSAQ